MKRTHKNMLGIVLALLLMVSCQEQPKEQKANPVEEKEVTPVYEEDVEKEKSLFQRIINWFKRLFR